MTISATWSGTHKTSPGAAGSPTPCSAPAPGTSSAACTSTRPAAMSLAAAPGAGGTRPSNPGYAPTAPRSTRSCTTRLLLSSSSYRQNFCFLVREEELERTLEAVESALALEFAHHYLEPVKVDREVGLLAAVGEGMQGKAGLAGRIFTAISRVQVNVIAIAQGSSELTIAVVVRRDGLEKAVRAVHAECGLGNRPPVPVFPFSPKKGGAGRP